MRRSSDYGGQPIRRGARLAFAVAGVCTATPLLAVTVGHEMSLAAAERAQARALTRALTRPGPACPELARAEFEARHRPLKNVFDYGGVRFARRFGHADCTMIGRYEPGGGEAYPVCRFTAPAVLRVTPNQGRAVIFEVGVGRAARVVVRDGRVRCVLTGPFGLS